MSTLKHQGCVVITGSSKGIGFALAEAFLKQGKAVVLSARNPAQLKAAQQKLIEKYSSERVHAVCGDITQTAQVLILWQQAVQYFHEVDIWVNNAGGCTASLDFSQIAPHEIQNVIQTNVVGSMLCAQVAVQGMLRQGHGQIFNMEGWGSRGEWSHGMTVYSTSKAAIRYFTHALYKETRGTPILVGTLSPGMVATELLVSSWKQGNPKYWRKMKRLFYFIIDPPHKVAAFLAQRMCQNQKTNVRIAWMTPWRLLIRFVQPYYWRRNPVQGTDLDHF
jgi:short-subunit dehydrogenase